MSIITAASAQQSAVQAAITAAVDGDTVVIPAQDVTWVGNITTNKRLFIQGGGTGAGATVGSGVNPTIIRDGKAATVSQDDTQIFTWNPPDTGPSRMSGITFYGTGYSGLATRGPHAGIIRISTGGSLKNFRMHHMTFNVWGTAGMSTFNLMGLVDHCYFSILPGGNGPGNYSFHDNYLGVGANGDNSWAQPSTIGTDQVLCFENCSFICQPFASFQFANDGWRGSRMVYRYCTYANVQGGNGHGLDSGDRERSMRHHEVYENDILWEPGQDNVDTWSGFRGGTGVLFNNRLIVQSGAALTRIANVGVFRATDDNTKWSHYSRAGRHTVNLTSSGTTATATSTSVAELGFLSGAPFYSQWLTITGSAVPGYNGTFAVLGSPSPDKVTFVTVGSNLPSSSGLIMSAWDGNTDDSGYPCMDQVGRGRGDYLQNYDTTPVGWPNQDPEPTYAWNNLKNGVLDPLVIGAAGSPSALVEGRDFFNIPKPGYTPLAYPHPLIISDGGGDAVPPVVTITGPTPNPTFYTKVTPL
jgi:hypothetical protein